MTFEVWHIATAFFLIGVSWGYALFHKEPEYKFNITLNKGGPKPLLPKTGVKITEAEFEKMRAKTNENPVTVTKTHAESVGDVIKKAKAHYKSLEAST